MVFQQMGKAMFNEKKITEMAVYLLQKTNGHQYHLKLMKLLYLAERKSYQRYGISMSDDKLVSMKYGPVLSNTLSLMQGVTGSNHWENQIEAIGGYRVMSRSDDIASFQSLTDSDKAILDEVWAEFGNMGRFELCDWTHDNCPEWQDPNGSVLPIKTERLLTVLGYNEADQAAIQAEKQADNNLQSIMASL